MDYIAGSFYDGFVLYAKALDETLAEGGAQYDGINITMRMQNRRFWGEQTSVTCLNQSEPFRSFRKIHVWLWQSVMFLLFYVYSLITNLQPHMDMHVCDFMQYVKLNKCE